VPPELIERALEEPADQGLAPADGASGAADASRALLDALVAHGAQPG